MSKINKKRTCLYFIHYCALVVLFFSFPILASVLGVGKILHFLQFRFSYLKKTKKLHCFLCEVSCLHESGQGFKSTLPVMKFTIKSAVCCTSNADFHVCPRIKSRSAFKCTFIGF